MNIIINAINLGSAGGRSVALNLINQFIELKDEETKLFVFAPKNKGYEKLPRLKGVNFYFLPHLLTNRVIRYYTDYFWLPQQIKKLAPDVTFSLGNFGVPSNSVGKQAVLFHNSYVIHFNEKEIQAVLSKKDYLVNYLMKRAFESRMKYVDIIFPQTKNVAKKLKINYPNICQLKTIPNAISLQKGEIQNYTLPFEKKKGVKYLLCLSYYYPHKNIKILIEVAKILKKKQLPIQLLITVEKQQHPDVSKLLNEIEENNLENWIYNLGAIPFQAVHSLYEQIDGSLMPTILESFSGIFIDSMFHKIPLFVSDRDFAREVCDNYGIYFDPHQPKNIVEAIHKIFDKNLIKEKIRLGQKRLKTFKNWRGVAEIYWNSIKKLV